jgi:hypothetical protein
MSWGFNTNNGGANNTVINGNFKDPHTHLHIIDHVLAESMYIKDLAGAVAAGG